MAKLNYSVIMSVYEKVDPEHLKESINSIINQTYKTNEFILIKDGPLTNEQNEVINSFLVSNKEIFKIIDLKENKGAGEAYNKGLEKCTNDWAAIMDSDDIALKTKFEKQMNFIEKYPDYDAVGTNAFEFEGNVDNVISKRIMPETNEEIIKFAKARCPLIQPTVIFKTKSVKEAGGYQTSQLTEDYDLYIRMIMNSGKLYNYQEILYYVRTNSDFFNRRGGIKYLYPILNFKFRHYKDGFYTTSEFVKTFMSSLVVSMMPNALRTYIYKKFLRD